ncbi:MAG: M28 family peptidase [Bacteroidales bacterium]
MKQACFYKNTSKRDSKFMQITSKDFGNKPPFHFNSKYIQMKQNAISIVLTLSLFLQLPLLLAQSTVNFSDSAVVSRLEKDIYALADESMEGREAGTEGEMIAAKYIVSSMMDIGLEPVFDESYLQDFEFVADFVYGDSCALKIGMQEYSSVVDFHILPNSADASVTAQGVYVGSGIEKEGEYAEILDVNDLEGKLLFIEYYMEPDKEMPDNHTEEFMVQQKIAYAKKYGASGIIFINTYEEYNDPKIRMSADVPRESIPIIYANRDVFEYYEQTEMYGDIFIKTQLERESLTAYNVAGYIDNNAPSTVVIGGHYDHLGYGGPTSRDYQQGEIHYGADDNASGIAGVLEAARYYSNNAFDDYNFLFIAFSAEEKGLLGSKFFADSDAYDINKINFMFNFDMIGRLKDDRLVLIGTGTASEWEDIIDNNKPEHLQLVKVQTGYGGSDHTNFYRKDIPVIFFYSGSHEDYHTSTDTPDKINFTGLYQILNFAYDMVDYTTQFDGLEFKTTSAPQSRRRRSDMVTLGIMPDHAFEGKGVKVITVIDDKPAQDAGVQAEDIIIAIDDNEVNEIYSYMKVLENLEKGQKVKVLILRDEEQIEIEIVL